MYKRSDGYEKKNEDHKGEKGLDMCHDLLHVCHVENFHFGNVITPGERTRVLRCKSRLVYLCPN